MRNHPLTFAWISLAASVALGFAAWWLSGFWQSLLLALVGTASSLSVALFAINFYLDKQARKVAAAPLAFLIETAINRFHNDYFVRLAHARFGSTKFGQLLKDFAAGQREPRVFSPEDKTSLSAMLQEHKEPIMSALRDVDNRFTTLVYVLGWSFDARVVANALEAKRNISEFIAAIESDEPDANDRAIKSWFDADLTANATRRRLAEILEVDLNAL